MYLVSFIWATSIWEQLFMIQVNVRNSHMGDSHLAMVVWETPICDYMLATWGQTERIGKSAANRPRVSQRGCEQKTRTSATTRPRFSYRGCRPPCPKTKSRKQKQRTPKSAATMPRFSQRGCRPPCQKMKTVYVCMHACMYVCMYACM